MWVRWIYAEARKKLVLGLWLCYSSQSPHYRMNAINTYSLSYNLLHYVLQKYVLKIVDDDTVRALSVTMWFPHRYNRNKDLNVKGVG